MNFNFSRNIQTIVISFLVCSTGALGYLYYDTYKTNIEDRELIKQISAENLDMSQDIEIYKDKYDRLKNEITSVKSKVEKITYRKKIHRKKFISSAGKSSKHRSHYSRSKVNYKKLYFQLKSECSKYKSPKKYNRNR
ncbi:MAG: hypothetical protein JNJ56_05445 [Ignavibacteria bacterium]|nr:hypothetical protein [Ignavibacteria bacterium]